MIYLTGDTHGRFDRIEQFCNRMNTSKDDILIILGDAGINFHENRNDMYLKQYIKKLPITLFCIHGNHEKRPFSIETYKEINFHKGIVYIEDEYPNILFAKDGEIYDFNGLRTIVIGGAYSVDKNIRLLRGYPWFEDEQPSADIKQYVEQQLDDNDWTIDIVLSHTTPLKYEPTEMFLFGIDQKEVDKSTEEWLDSIEDKLNYNKWYCGHYHTEKKIDKLQIMFNYYTAFPEKK